MYDKSFIANIKKTTCHTIFTPDYKLIILLNKKINKKNNNIRNINLYLAEIRIEILILRSLTLF